MPITVIVPVSGPSHNRFLALVTPSSRMPARTSGYSGGCSAVATVWKPGLNKAPCPITNPCPSTIWSLTNANQNVSSGA